MLHGGSRGIGACLVKELALQGYHVVSNYFHSKDEAFKLMRELEKEGIKVIFCKADVSKRKDCNDLVDIAMQEYGKIDYLINNAGISETKLFLDITELEWNKIIETNLNSAFFMTQEVVNKSMLKEKSGCIINISSIWGMVGASCEVAYSVSKAAMDGLTKSLAKELGMSNIRVNSIAPGIIQTDMNKQINDEDIKDIKSEIPLQRIGDTMDIYRCVKWLLEDNYTTGQIISPNGGWVIT